MTEQPPKAMRVIAGTMLMVAFTLILIAVVTRYAGAWGVPYFSFVSDRGSRCTNNFTGYVCTPLTLADVEYYADVNLPNTTKVLAGTYTATHDYEMEVRLRTPPKEAAAALKALTGVFGPCGDSQVAPAGTEGLSTVCVMGNQTAVSNDGQPASRIWLVGSGLEKNGSRVTTLAVRSR